MSNASRRLNPDGTPEGSVQLEAFAYHRQIVVLGSPDPDEDPETGHNCDAMGCGQSHVILRINIHNPETWRAITRDPGIPDRPWSEVQPLSREERLALRQTAFTRGLPVHIRSLLRRYDKATETAEGELKEAAERTVEAEGRGWQEGGDHALEVAERRVLEILRRAEATEVEALLREDQSGLLGELEGASAWLGEAISELRRLRSNGMDPAGPEERSACAAYLLDRAAQYGSASSMAAALGELAQAVARGEHAEAAAHGELDDLMPRVRRLQGQEPGRS